MYGRRTGRHLQRAGQLTFATSYYSTGSIVNQVENVYDGLGNLVTQYQSHCGGVVIGTTPAVQYQYTTMYAGTGNYSRLTQVTYPDAATVAPAAAYVTYGYSGLDRLDQPDFVGLRARRGRGH